MTFVRSPPSWASPSAADKDVVGQKHYMALLVNRARMEGFVVFDHADRYPEALRDMAGWLAERKLLEVWNRARTGAGSDLATSATDSQAAVGGRPASWICDRTDPPVSPFRRPRRARTGVETESEPPEEP